MSYEARIITLKQHLEQSKEIRSYLTQVFDHGRNNTIRIPDELQTKHEIKVDTDLSSRSIAKFYFTKE